MKTCTKCGCEKELTEFYSKKSGRDGKNAICKGCEKDRVRVWELANPDKVRARARGRRAANPDMSNAYQRSWRLANLEKQRARSRAKYRALKLSNPNKVEARRRASYLANLDKVTAQNNAWKLLNQDLIKSRRKAEVDSLATSYISRILDVPASSLTPELIEMKREQLAHYRLAKEIKTKLKEKSQ